MPASTGRVRRFGSPITIALPDGQNAAWRLCRFG
jgi:hypothetical protein